MDEWAHRQLRNISTLHALLQIHPATASLAAMSERASVERRAAALLQHFLPGSPLLQVHASTRTTAAGSSSGGSVGGSGNGDADSVRAQIDFQQPMTDDVKYLSTKLLRIISQVEGEEIAMTVTQLVEMSRAYRSSGNEAQFRQLEQAVSALVHQPPVQSTPRSPSACATPMEAAAGGGGVGGIGVGSAPSLVAEPVLQVARCLHELLSLSNVCESHHRIRRWRTYLRGEGNLAQKQQPEDMSVPHAEGHTDRWRRQRSDSAGPHHSSTHASSARHAVWAYVYVWVWVNGFVCVDVYLCVRVCVPVYICVCVCLCVRFLTVQFSASACVRHVSIRHSRAHEGANL